MPVSVVHWRAPESTPPLLDSGEAIIARNLVDSDLLQLSRAVRVKYLDISGSPISDSGVRYLLPLKELAFLSVAGCDEISDEGLGTIGELSRLEVLDLSHCSQISDLGVNHLQSLGRLREVCLDACYNITDAAMVSLSSLPSLEAVSLWSCEEITNQGIVSLARAPRLESVDLPEFSRIDDDGISALLHSAKNITRLRIANLEALTDKGVFAIATSKMEHLELSFCGEVTDAGIGSLVALPALRHLTVEACPRVSAQAVEVLRHRFPSARIDFS